jgi:exonuclease VII small subunit
MSSTEPGDGAIPVTELTYTEASRELDAIVGFFEQREVDVDQLVIRLERATAIVDELDRRVRKTRAQVEELVPRLEAVTRAGVEDGADDVDDDEVDVELHEIDDVDMLDPQGDDDEGEEQALF